MRAIQLMIELADAKVEGVVETGNNKLEPIEITLRYPQIKRILGVEIAPEKCDSILEKLGFEKLGGNALAAKFLVPSFRAYDVTREIDLIEEIARINGYDQVTPTLPNKMQTPVITLEEKVVKKVNDIMRAEGLNEIVTSSLIGKPLLDKFMIPYDDSKALKVLNPVSEECTMLRETIAVSVLNCMKYNYDNGQKNFWAYEIGKTYNVEGPADEKSSGVKETKVLGGVITGEIENSKWQPSGYPDFFTVKGILETLFNELGVEKRIKFVEFDKSPLAKTHTILHPYKSAAINVLGKNMTTIGYFGQIHPILKDKLKMNQDAFIFKVDLDAIISIIKESTPRFKHLPQFPEVRRDLAFVIGENVSYDDLQRVIKGGVQQNIFKGSEVFDVYQGEHIDKGYKSMAFRIYMQDEHATLTDEVIEKQMQNVREKLQKTYADITFRE